jgi:HEAT repeat protein
MKKRPFILVCAGCLVIGSAIAAYLVSKHGKKVHDLAPDDHAKTAPVQDKPAAHWISQLEKAPDDHARAEAAEALGYMARQSRWTHGGFSDLPEDEPDPPKLSDEELHAIVSALIAGLDDSHERVRAASAIALSWIGSRAQAALPDLTRVLEDADDRVRTNALKAIGSIGPAALAANSKLQSMLASSRGYHRVKVAEALRLIGAAPESYVPALIELLGQHSKDNAEHYAAMELAHLGDLAVGALKQALRHENPRMRQYAAYAISNMAGWGNLTNDREGVADALIELAREDDASTLFKAAQALGSVHAAADRSVPALVSLLKHPDEHVAEEAAESLGDFGAEAKAALPALIGVLESTNIWTVAYAIREIGIDRAAAEAIGTLKLSEHGSWLFLPLCEYPDVAVEFLDRNPEVVDVPVRDEEALVGLMRDPDPRFAPLQKLLYENEHLPLTIIAPLGERRFLPLLERKRKTADPYMQTKLEACSRACGAPAGRVVAIDASHPGDFKPKSAWPDTDPDRMAPEMRMHGDGITHVIITGHILREGGAPAAAPKFYRVNDSMLMGERIREEVPITFDAETSRFVFVTSVFAAYSHGDGQKEPGPYQTGSSLIVIESQGCQPLQLQFYDEMPEVRITLQTATK